MLLNVDTNTSKFILLNSGPQLPLSILPDLCCFVCLLSLLLPLSRRKILHWKSFRTWGPRKLRAGQTQKKSKTWVKNCSWQLWFRHSFSYHDVAMCSFLLFRMFQTRLDCFVQTIKKIRHFFTFHMNIHCIIQIVLQSKFKAFVQKWIILLEATTRQYYCVMAKSFALISDVIRFKTHR